MKKKVPRPGSWSLVTWDKDKDPGHIGKSLRCHGHLILNFFHCQGPIPFIYSAEVFPQNARSSAMAICIFTNWASGKRKEKDIIVQI